MTKEYSKQERNAASALYATAKTLLFTDGLDKVSEDELAAEVQRFELAFGIYDEDFWYDITPEKQKIYDDITNEHDEAHNE